MIIDVRCRPPLEEFRGTPQDFEKYLEAETNKWRKVIAKTGIRAE